ncbi:MAG TPA: hypothetical protein DIU15_14655, partial [Deltaproteobacteria bacterium]|nr:hypothetical protein [Deltaproteobacteria bacterium]
MTAPITAEASVQSDEQALEGASFGESADLRVVGAAGSAVEPYSASLGISKAGLYLVLQEGAAA